MSAGDIEALPDLELLELVLGSKTDATALWQLSNGCLKSALTTLAPGIRRTSVARARAAVEVARRLSEHKEKRLALKRPSEVFAYARARFLGLRHEEFHVLCLNNRNVVIRDVRAAMGTTAQCAVDPKEIFAPAILSRASGVILIHNHPSGDPEPSHEDLTLTSQVTRGGKALGIKVLDHMVFTEQKFVSMRERNRAELE